MLEKARIIKRDVLDFVTCACLCAVFFPLLFIELIAVIMVMGLEGEEVVSERTAAAMYNFITKHSIVDMEYPAFKPKESQL